MVSALGGTPSRLIERGANPDVSRDGRRIVFEVRAGGQSGIWTAASDGSDLRQVSGTAPLYYSVPMGPALSPDGSQVAYFHAAAGPNGDFWVIPSAGGTPRRLTSDLREGGWPVWTPEGNAIVFSSARAGSRTLWQVPVHGGEPTPLTTGAGEDDQPDVTADGRQLAYTNVRHAWELKTRELSTGAIERSFAGVSKRSIRCFHPMAAASPTSVAPTRRWRFSQSVPTDRIRGSSPAAAS